MLKIGFGTYGMPSLDPHEALSGLAALGYEAVEICVADRWPTAPRKLSPGERERLRERMESLRLELPALLLFVNLLAEEGPALAAEDRLFFDACALARDLAPDAPPAIVTTLGKCDEAWEAAFPRVAERVRRFGSLAEGEGCRLALEPHVGSLLDRPARVRELMEAAGSPAVGINFDISHFAVGGYPRAGTIALLAAYALHTHVKDGFMEDGKVRFLLPGEGDFDYIAYWREMWDAGYRGCITIEVSVQIYDRPGYQPWEAARFCLETLRRARDAAFPGAVRT